MGHPHQEPTPVYWACCPLRGFEKKPRASQTDDKIRPHPGSPQSVRAALPSSDAERRCSTKSDTKAVDLHAVPPDTPHIPAPQNQTPRSRHGRWLRTSIRCSGVGLSIPESRYGAVGIEADISESAEVTAGLSTPLETCRPFCPWAGQDHPLLPPH